MTMCKVTKHVPCTAVEAAIELCFAHVIIAEVMCGVLYLDFKASKNKKEG